MADLKILVGLDVNNSIVPIKKDIDTLNQKLQSDKDARVKLVAELDPTKSIEAIKTSLGTLNKDIRLTIDNISFGNINIGQLQNNLNQATQNIKPIISITPILDRSAFKDTESYINEIINRLSNPNIANNINFNTMLKGLKESFGLANKDIKTELSNFIQALKLTPNDKQAIISSYENLMGAIENASGVTQGKDFTENLSDAIYRLATTFPEASNKAKQATQSMTDGLNQATQAAGQTQQAIQKISTGATGNSNYIYQSNQSLIESIKYLDAESNAIERVQNEFLSLSSVTGVTTSEIAKDSDTVVAFTANVTNSEGALERFRYALQDITTEEQKAQGQESVFKYVLQDITAADAGIKKLEESAKRWASTTSAAAQKIRGDLDRLEIAWNTPNSGKTIESKEHLDSLNTQYARVVNAIEDVKRASREEFAEKKTIAENEKRILEQNIALYVKQEKVATSLRTKGIDTNIAIKGNEINTFIRQVENSNVPLVTMRKDVDSLLTSIQALIDNPNMDKALKATEFTKVMDSLDIAKSKFKDLQDMFKGFGTADWLKLNKDQINSFNDLNTKVSIYRELLKSLRDTWNPQKNAQGIQEVTKAFSDLVSQGTHIGKNTEKYNEWVAKINEVIKASENLRSNLDSQVSVQKQIYQVQSEIAKLNIDPEGNKNQLARRQAELENLQKQQTSLLNLSNFYTKLLPIEQQEAYVSEQTRVEREKLLDIEAQIADKRNKSTVQAFDKANTQIVKENLDKIVNAYRQIETLSNQIAKGNIGTNEVAVNKELIALQEERIKLATEDLEKNGLLTNEIRNQIEAEKQRVTESQKKVQAQASDTAIAQQARAYEQQAKAIQTYTKQIQNDINQLNRMSVNTIFSTNANNTQAQAQKTVIQELTKEYEKLKATLNGNISAADLDKVKTRLAELRVQLDNAKVGMNNLKTSMQSDKSAQKLAGDIAILTAQIKQFRASNSRSEGKFGAEYDELLQKLKQNPDVSGLYAIRQQFRQLQGDVRAAGLTGTTFFDKLKADTMKFSAWFGVAAPGMLIAREIRQMFSEVINLDTALVDLRKTFVGTNADLEEFYYSANDIAKQLGVTTEEVITQASAWSRLG